MSKKKQETRFIEMLDVFVPIICICWILVFGYIAIFAKSSTIAYITVVPIIFLYGLYLFGSAIYCYKELEILQTLERDTRKAEKRNREKKTRLSIPKICVGSGCIVLGILLCIFL